MSHGDDIRAVHARADLSLDEKRALTYGIKGDAYRGIAAQLVSQSWQDEELIINVTSMDVDEQHRVIVRCEAWRADQPLALDLPFIFINPPLVHQDQESPLAALQHIIAETVRRL